MAARKKNWGTSERYSRPDGEIRQSQLITTFGPGALVDLVDDAVIIGGLDFWHFPDKLRYVDEPRLRDDLVERMRTLGRKLDTQHPFREPPPGDPREATPYRGIDALEFPRWFVCQNPRCRALVKSEHLERKKDRYWHNCDDGGASECVPIRFVAACKNGHIDEFAWVYWVHEKNGGACAAPRLRLLEGATGDFAEVRVRCVCGAVRPLINATIDVANPPCAGRRPWLGSEGDEDCGEHVRLLVRSASNGYFSQVESALSIPEPESSVRDLVQSNWDVLQNANDVATLKTLRSVIPKLKVVANIPDEDVISAIEDIRAGRPAAREPLRVAEYRQLVNAPPEVTGEVPAPEETFHARQISLPEPIAGIRSVVLVKKLRQVRVQVGFTRLEAATANLQGEYVRDEHDLGVKPQQLGLTTEWLPASEIRGEGIFIELDEAAVHAWEMKAAVMERAKLLDDGYETWREERGVELGFPGARFYLLHSLSHLLMSALSLECGYPASSLTERIYCAPHAAPLPMAGVLLLTGSPSAEGTLGGLVEEGRRLAEHLSRALDLARLCSNDPVCAQHTPDGDLAERHLEGAACHGCLYVAECSCERFNNFLDRALVVPTLGPSGTAFFGEDA